MTPAQETHLRDIKSSFESAVDKKYRNGQAEHGGNLWDRNVLYDMMQEAVDQVTYAHTAIERDNKLRLIIHNWRSGHVKPEEALKQLETLLGFQ